MTKAKLNSYTKKRDFKKTPEPAGKSPAKKKSKALIFVVQKHDARNLHYDFRLEIDGALKSWAVPKGPSTDSHDKRLALETEDHPLAYANFEGVIPEGNYGAGTVLVWDKGTFRNLKEDSLEKQYRKGQIEVWLKGKKLKGGYALTKMKGRSQWLLIKMRDEKIEQKLREVMK